MAVRSASFRSPQRELAGQRRRSSRPAPFRSSFSPRRPASPKLPSNGCVFFRPAGRLSGFCLREFPGLCIRPNGFVPACLRLAAEERPLPCQGPGRG